MLQQLIRLNAAHILATVWCCGSRAVALPVCIQQVKAVGESLLLARLDRFRVQLVASLVIFSTKIAVRLVLQALHEFRHPSAHSTGRPFW